MDVCTQAPRVRQDKNSVKITQYLIRRAQKTVSCHANSTMGVKMVRNGGQKCAAHADSTYLGRLTVDVCTQAPRVRQDKKSVKITQYLIQRAQKTVSCHANSTMGVKMVRNGVQKCAAHADSTYIWGG